MLGMRDEGLPNRVCLSEAPVCPTGAREGAGGGVAVEEGTRQVGKAQAAQLLGGVELVLVLLGQGAGDGDGLADVDEAYQQTENNLHKQTGGRINLS